jgi:tubulin-folding cofactor B|uniref:CAP-Gly domain-containing protein n=1 Tax=Panagrolaimus sp. PS1159 TaxID=55785 RepID=A0AC35F5J8_9BILA
MSTSIALTVKKTDGFVYEKKFVESQTLLEFKQKLELITGVLANQMKLELHDAEDKFIKPLENDNGTLAEAGVKDDMIIKVQDIHGNNSAPEADVPHYVMSDDKYAQREDNLRKWKESIISNIEPQQERLESHIVVGNRVIVKMPNKSEEKHGKIEFVGETLFKPDIIWVGVSYDEAVGKNDGSVDGHRYFTTKPNHGAFIRPVNVFPEPDEVNEI